MQDRTVEIIGQSISQEKEYRTIHKVPQGGVLSSLLFNLYTANTEEGLGDSTILTQYADDIAVSTTNNSITTAKVALEMSVAHIMDNLQKLNLELSPEKTEILVVSKHTVQPHSILFDTGREKVPNKELAKFLNTTYDTCKPSHTKPQTLSNSSEEPDGAYAKH
ncbi:unnamed protein product [Xylocopa violacea]|uniref:Reverse transcriptase domain-containing protein n=1 Tax=Xylocopa violacea TaxID=135666 RepID=A0ABP1P6J2_XYLVO